MRVIDDLMSAQKKRVLDGLAHSFKSSAILGGSHSLADCDFCDSNNFFPEYGFSSSGIQIDQLFLTYWSEEDKVSVMKQIQQGKVIYKEYLWSEVSATYLNKHRCGFFYLDDHAFKFYLCSWISLQCNFIPERVSSNGMEDFSDRLFRVLSDEFVGSVNSWWCSLSKEQIHTIINFLIFVVMSSPNDRYIAQKCLESGWLDYDGYGVDVLQKFNEEKMIQDFR